MARVTRANETLTGNSRLLLQQHINRSSMDSLVDLSAEDSDPESPTSDKFKRVLNELAYVLARNNMSIDNDINEDIQQRYSYISIYNFIIFSITITIN